MPYVSFTSEHRRYIDAKAREIPSIFLASKVLLKNTRPYTKIIIMDKHLRLG